MISLEIIHHAPKVANASRAYCGAVLKLGYQRWTKLEPSQVTCTACRRDWKRLRDQRVHWHRAPDAQIVWCGRTVMDVLVSAIPGEVTCRACRLGIKK